MLLGNKQYWIYCIQIIHCRMNTLVNNFNKIALTLGSVLSLVLIVTYVKRSIDSTDVSVTNTIDTTHASNETSQSQPPSSHPPTPPDRKLSNNEESFKYMLRIASNSTAPSLPPLLLTNFQIVSSTKSKLQNFQVEDGIKNDVQQAFKLEPSEFCLIYINNNTIATLERILSQSEQYGGNLDIDDGSKNTSDTKLIFVGVKDTHKEKIKEFQEPHFTTTIEGDTYRIL